MENQFLNKLNTQALEWPILDLAGQDGVQATSSQDSSAEAIPEAQDLMPDLPLPRLPEMPSLVSEGASHSNLEQVEQAHKAQLPNVEFLEYALPVESSKGFPGNHTLPNLPASLPNLDSDKPTYPDNQEIPGQDSPIFPENPSYQVPASPPQGNLESLVAVLEKYKPDEYGGPKQIREPEPVNTMFAGRITPPMDLLNRLSQNGYSPIQ